MAEDTKKMRDDLFEDVPYDENLFEDVPFEAQDEYSGLGDVLSKIEEDEKSSTARETAEDFVTGLGRGTTVGLGDEMAGAIGAFIPNPTADVDEQLAAQGFKGAVEEKQSLLDRYREARDYARSIQDRASERSPIASGIGEFVGGAMVPGMGAAGQATKLAKFARTTAAGIGAGSLVGAGESEADLTKGEVGQFTKDVATGGAIGGAIPAVISGGAVAAGKIGRGIKTLAQKITPKEFSTGYKYGRETGKAVTTENIMSDLKEFAGDVKAAIEKPMKEAGLDKKSIDDFADEIGVKVNAGASIENAIEEAIDFRANIRNPEFAKTADKWVEIAEGWRDPNNKVAAKLKESLDRKLTKGKLQGANVIGTVGVDPATNRQAYVISNPKTGKTLATVSSEASEVGDLGELTVKEARNIIKEVDKVAYQDYIPDREVVNQARKLKRELQMKIDEAIDASTSTVLDQNKKLSKLLRAKDAAGIGSKNIKSAGQYKVDDEIDQLRKFIIKEGDDANIRRERFFDYLKDSGSKDVDALKKSFDEFKDLSSLAKTKQTLFTEAGRAKFVASGGQHLGRGVNWAAKKTGAENASKLIKKGFKNLESWNSEMFMDAAQRLRQMKGGESFANALDRIATMDGAKKSAAIFGLYQTPAFRELLGQLKDADAPSDVSETFKLTE